MPSRMHQPRVRVPARTEAVGAGDPLRPRLPAVDLVAAGLLLRSPGPRITARWLLLRATKHGEWGFPKGHADPGEDHLATALRECVEECGIALLEIEGPPVVLTYALPSGKNKAVLYYPAITATTAVILSHEHDDARWCTAAEVLKLLPHPALRRLFLRHHDAPEADGAPAVTPPAVTPPAITPPVARSRPAPKPAPVAGVRQPASRRK